MQLDTLFLGMGMTKSSIELLTLVFVLFFISVIFWVLIGRFRLHNFLINTYISFVGIQVMPKDVLKLNDYMPVILFLLFIVILTLLNQYLFDIHQVGSGLALWQVFVMSFLEVGMLVSIILPYIPSKEVLKYISKDSIGYFTDPWSRMIWMFLPLIFLIIVNKRRQ